jgi:hypothetical protein
VVKGMEKKTGKEKSERVKLYEEFDSLNGFTEKIDYSQYQPKLPTIRTRTKKDPFKVEGFVNFNTIKLKIEASPEDWKNIIKYFSESPDLFVDDIFGSFINPVIQKIKFKPVSGKFRGKEPFYNALRNASVWLYLFVSYWSKKDIKTWPKSLRKAIENLDVDIEKQRIEDKETFSIIKYTPHREQTRYDSKAITYYFIKRHFKRDMETFKVRWDSPESFYDIYVARNPLYKENKKRFVRLKMHSRLEATPFLTEILT